MTASTPSEAAWSHATRADTRGILDPGRMRTRVAFERPELTELREGPLAGLVEWAWTARWRLADGEMHEQPVLAHPCANLSLGPASTRGAAGEVEAVVNGVCRGVDVRRLHGSGATVAVKLRAGALGAFLRQPAATLTDRVEPLSTLGIDVPALVRAAQAAGPDPTARLRPLVGALTQVIERASPHRVRAARECADIAARAATDPAVCTTRDLAAAAGVTSRSLQRLFREHAGVSPLWVLRRYRLLEAAERARAGGRVPWGELAAELGYADQAHLVRDFSAAVGLSPAAYARSVTPLT